MVLSCSVWLGGGGYAHTHSTLHQKHDSTSRLALLLPQIALYKRKRQFLLLVYNAVIRKNRDTRKKLMVDILPGISTREKVLEERKLWEHSPKRAKLEPIIVTWLTFILSEKTRPIMRWNICFFAHWSAPNSYRRVIWASGQGLRNVHDQVKSRS